MCHVSMLEQLYSQAAARDRKFSDVCLRRHAGASFRRTAATRFACASGRRAHSRRAHWVGRAPIGGAQYAQIEWIRYPGSVPNAEFIEQLRQVATPDMPVLFLRRDSREFRARGCRGAERRGSASRLTCWKGSRAIRTGKGIGRRCRDGASVGCRGSGPELSLFRAYAFKHPIINECIACKWSE